MTAAKTTGIKPQPSKKFGPKLMLGTLAAVSLIAFWEGGKDPDGSSVVYADKLAQGLPTVCSGITKWTTDAPLVVGERWSADRCLAAEQIAVIKIQTQLEQCFEKRPPQSVFDSATSHAWNFGSFATCYSSAMRAWNAGDWAIGCRRLAFDDNGRMIWSYVKTGKILPNGKPEYKFIQGLANRRQDEYIKCVQWMPEPWKPAND